MLAANGLIAPGAWRLPEGEVEPASCDGERVLLTTHMERGYSLPPHPCFRGFLNFFGAQIHHSPQHDLVSSCIHLYVRKLPRVPATLGPIQTHLHLPFSDGEEG